VFIEYGNFDLTIDIIGLGYGFVISDLMFLIIAFIIGVVVILFSVVGAFIGVSIRLRFQTNVCNAMNNPWMSFFGIKFDGLAFGMNYFQIIPQFDTPNLKCIVLLMVVINIAFGQMYFEFARFVSDIYARKCHWLASGFECRDANFDMGGDILDGTFVFVVMIIRFMILMAAVWSYFGVD
jgi:hypothetical protein